MKPSATIPSTDRPDPPFRILGPLEVGAAPGLEINARRQRVVLALLLLSPNQLVPLDAMIEGVWGEDPPTTARSQVQTAVSVLRKSLAAAGLGERIRMAGHGYSIRIAAHELDLQVFDELVAQGRAFAAAAQDAAARSAFRAALDLWRAEPLSDVDSDAVGARTVRLAGRRVEVLEECLDAELRLGLHHELLGEIKALVAEYPLRERPVGQLMTALYRSGRPAEALEAFRDLRRVLIDELGLEPSPALHRLEVAILNGAADLDRGSHGSATSTSAAAAARPVPRMLPPGVLDYTDLGGTLDTLCRRLSPQSTGTESARRDAKQVAVISGPSGAGKSALAVAAAWALAPDFPDGQLYALLPDGPDSASRVLERFLLSLGVPAQTIPSGAEERSALYRSTLAERRLLVVVEDAVDEKQIRLLIPGAATCRLIVTTRARPAAPPGAVRLELEVPGRQDGVELLAAMIGRDRVALEPSEALELVDLCGAVPCALRAVANRLAARPHWTLAQLAARLRDEDRRLDELTGPGLDARAASRAAFARLDTPAKRLFVRLGRLGDAEFGSWLAAPLLDADPATAADVLEALVDERLAEVVACGGAAGRHRLAALARLFAREQSAAMTSPAEQAETRRRVFGAWLALADEAAARRTGTSGFGHGGAERWPVADTVAAALLTDPAAWYARERTALLAAVREAAAHRESEYCWNLAIAVAALAERQPRFEDWRECALRALAAARGEGDRFGEAVMLHSLGSLDLREHRYDLAAARFRVCADAFAALDETEWRERAVRSTRAVRRLQVRPLILGGKPGHGPATTDPRGRAERRSAVRAVPSRFGLAAGRATPTPP